METVGLEELMARLEEVVHRAQRGERFLLTEEGVALAELAPISSVRGILLDRAQRGELRWSGGKPQGLRGVSLRGEPLSATILRARG